ncbi:MAG: universal stress protein [Thermodesulfobacteriota bacterium]
MSFKSILHPTDFSEQSMVAFNHALKLAVEQKAKLILMYAMEENKHILDWEKFPKVRDTLYKWGLIKKDASRQDIYNKLGVEVQKIIGRGENIIDSVTGLVHDENIDLIVLTTHGSEGLPRWAHSSISEPIARKALVPTLFIPYNSRPFVSEEDGELKLNEILVPIDHKPNPQRAVEFGINMGKIFGKSKAQIHIMHVLESKKPWSDNDMPEINLPDGEDCILRFEYKRKTIDEEIMRVADEIKTDLIVIATEGHTGFLDVLYGSTSEQILHKSKCPVLTIPSAQGEYLPRYYEEVSVNS